VRLQGLVMGASEETATESTPSRDGWFRTTRWTVVIAAGQSSPQADAALAQLCQTYWYPLYVFIRRRGHDPEDAQDIVQGFFAQLLRKSYFRDAAREKGRFRSFLLMALKRYMANEWDRANRLKRGGGHEVISLDEAGMEIRFLTQPANEGSPEAACDRQWAMVLLDLVLKRLEAEFSAAGKTQLFEQLKGLLSGEKTATSYAELGQKLGLTEGAVKVAVHRLRQRYRELLREEIAHTVSSPEDVNDEIRHLFAALT
jgi:RNA polymerase sigma factor (sigma-70 family)